MILSGTGFHKGIPEYSKHNSPSSMTGDHTMNNDRALNSHSFRVSLTHFNAFSLSHSLTPQSHSFLHNLTQISLIFNDRARVWLVQEQNTFF